MGWFMPPSALSQDLVLLRFQEFTQFGVVLDNQDQALALCRFDHPVTSGVRIGFKRWRRSACAAWHLELDGSALCQDHGHHQDNPYRR